MSYMLAVPEAFTSAAQDLTGIGSSLRSATFAAAPSTTSIAAAAQDEVSAAISALFGNFGQEFQALSAQMVASQEQFVQALRSGGLMYGLTEAANANPLGALTSAAQNAGAFEIFGRPLFGDGTNGAPGDRAGRWPRRVVVG